MPDGAGRSWCVQPGAILGVVVALSGLACLGGGLALLAWRLAEPESAVLLPPGNRESVTPTPGWLGTPLDPPPLPAAPSTLVILPVSERPAALASIRPPSLTARPLLTATPSPTPAPRPSVTMSPTPTPSPAPPAAARPPFRTPVPTGTPTPTPATAAPSATPTAAPWPSPAPAVPDRIVIDAIGLDAPVVPVGQHSVVIEGQVYSQWDVPDRRAAGWHQGSARLGERGNLVINGHHNLDGEVFRYLFALKPGDLVTLESGGRRFVYGVAQTMTLAEQDQPAAVRQANARWILPTGDERVTLVTCWPYEANTHRLIVIALPLAALGLPPEIP